MWKTLKLEIDHKQQVFDVSLKTNEILLEVRFPESCYSAEKKCYCKKRGLVETFISKYLK
tara:strand:+ start:767 stop:946 length:180 start_codon:yes stop_codon:yes gene_type:complete